MKTTPELLPDEDGPSPIRAVIAFMANIIVFPGLGTLISGDHRWRRTGLLQFGFAAGFLSTSYLIATGKLSAAGQSLETLHTWISHGMTVLMIWVVITGIHIFRGAWKRARAIEKAQAGQLTARATQV